MGRSQEGSESSSVRKKGSPGKVSRSIRLRKYEAAYKTCLEKTNSQPRKVSEKPSRSSKQPIVREQYSKRSLTQDSKKVKDTTRKEKEKEDTPKRPLNPYQKFLQTESKREKYRAKSPKSRMSAIATAWKKKKDKDSSEQVEERMNRKREKKL